ncbi:MAG: hypothetical protein R3E79_28885 [Caldilineaceae bacterium]
MSEPRKPRKEKEGAAMEKGSSVPFGAFAGQQTPFLADYTLILPPTAGNASGLYDQGADGVVTGECPR